MMSSITKSIQNEYVLLMENAFSEKYKYAFRNLELKELRRFILKELISSPELDNQLTNLIVLLNKFWDTHAAALITEVRASKSYRLLLPIQRFGYNISNHLRSLGIYFDSIIMVDPLHFPSISSLHSFLSLPPDNSYVRMRRLVLLEHISNLFSKHLINVVEEYGKSHESAIKNSKKKKVSSGLIFAGTATLGIASLAMPQLTLLSAAATGIGLAFGGKSLADIFSEHKAHKNEIQMLEKTPVSLLYGAYKKK
ncbi:hypothetical protein CNP37_15995 [Salmonella enterica subsp. enterica serovar Muenchen]|nr:hypothetical protein [Salmonella enterica subsp. enterica serovar Muenchen]